MKVIYRKTDDKPFIMSDPDGSMLVFQKTNTGLVVSFSHVDSTITFDTRMFATPFEIKQLRWWLDKGFGKNIGLDEESEKELDDFMEGLENGQNRSPENG